MVIWMLGISFACILHGSGGFLGCLKSKSYRVSIGRKKNPIFLAFKTWLFFATLSFRATEFELFNGILTKYF